MESLHQSCIEQHQHSLDLLRALRRVEGETIYFLMEAVRQHQYEPDGDHDNLSSLIDVEKVRTKMINVARQKVKQYSKYLPNAK